MKLNDHQLIYELRHWESSTAMLGSLMDVAASAIERLIEDRAKLYVALDDVTAKITNIDKQAEMDANYTSFESAV